MVKDSLAQDHGTACFHEFRAGDPRQLARCLSNGATKQ